MRTGFRGQNVRARVRQPFRQHGSYSPNGGWWAEGGPTLTQRSDPPERPGSQALGTLTIGARPSLHGRTRSDVELAEWAAIDRSASGRSRPKAACYLARGEWLLPTHLFSIPLVEPRLLLPKKIVVL